MAKDRDNKLNLMRVDKHAEAEALQQVNEEIEKKIEEEVFSREDL